MKRRLIFNGKKVNEEADLSALINSLQDRRQYMHTLLSDDLLDYFDQLVIYWNKSGLVRKHPYLKNLSDFLSRKKMVENLTVALHGDYTALDKFVALGQTGLSGHAQPRGLTVHWLAGNVAVLGLFSVFSALITKNVCLIKASSRSYEELVDLLSTLTQVKTKAIDGLELAKSIAVILLEHEDREAHQSLSSAADVRIAWGGVEAIETIVGLKKNLYSEDIVFGPKYSYALIDHDSLEASAKKIAQRLAIDVSVFDQYACSSPHTVFVQGKKQEVVSFASELASQLDFVNRTLLPKEKVDPAKAMEILDLRSEYELKGQVISSKGTEWTVIISEEDGLAKGCFSRVVFIKPIEDFSTLKKLNDRQKQTLSIALSSANKARYLDEITLYGLDRCPDLGYATFYEMPWDGMFVFDRLVRWVSTYQ